MCMKGCLTPVMYMSLTHQSHWTCIGNWAISLIEIWLSKSVSLSSRSRIDTAMCERHVKNGEIPIEGNYAHLQVSRDQFYE